jgi:hypothetical protein
MWVHGERGVQIFFCGEPRDSLHRLSIGARGLILVPFDSFAAVGAGVVRSCSVNVTDVGEPWPRRIIPRI